MTDNKLDHVIDMTAALTRVGASKEVIREAISVMEMILTPYEHAASTEQAAAPESFPASDIRSLDVFCELLAIARQTRTQGDVAVLLGTTPATISRVENRLRGVQEGWIDKLAAEIGKRVIVSIVDAES